MSVCTQCGATLGVGRFCINCGHPVGAEVPATPEPGSGYPLFADEVIGSGVPTHRHAGPRTRASRPAWLPWVVGALALLLVGVLGAWLWLGGDADPTPTATDPTGSATAESSDPAPSSADPTEEPTSEPTEEPTEEPTAQPSEPSDVARFATAIVPVTAPPSEDGDGNAVRYEARNMLDGVPETTWRMPGDGTGETLTFELGSPTTISAVGLINGYAKTATEGGTTLDWYAGNRRILAVEWLFDDGTLVRQDLSETRALQSIDVEPVTTETVQVRLVTVSAPGEGRSSRDYTAVSEVSLIGSPG